MNLQKIEIKKLSSTFNEYITEKTCEVFSTLLKEPIQHKLTMLENNVNVRNICLTSKQIKLHSVRLNGKGDIHIELLYTLRLEDAMKIASKLLGSEVNKIDEMGESALQEVANILTGSFFNALSKDTGFRIDLSTPTFKEGELEELLSEPTNDVNSNSEDIVIADVLLTGKNSKTEIHMIIIQHPEHAKKLISHESKDIEESKYSDKSNTNLLGGQNDAIEDLLKNL